MRIDNNLVDTLKDIVGNVLSPINNVVDFILKSGLAAFNYLNHPEIPF